MKYLVLAICLVGFAVAHSPLKADKVKETDKVKEADYIKECTASSGTSQESIDKSLKGDFSEDVKFKEYLLCRHKKMGVLNAAGEYQLEAMKTRLTAKYGEEVASTVIKACTEKPHAVALETSYQLAKCCYSKTPKDAVVV